MSYGRESPIIRYARTFQDLYRFCAPLDHLFRLPLRLHPPRDIPVVCIVAPPRSGSTLTYQVLTTALKNTHLTNIWNLLYATPALGGVVSKLLCRRHISSFSSTHGFVPGLCGEAEGLKFWSYWSGQTLQEDAGALKPEKLRELKGVLDMLASPDEPFITGYLGHAFSMEQMRAHFDRIVFVYVSRDLLSNAYSLLKISGEEWSSLRPKACSEKEYNSRYERVADQLVSIHESILSQSLPGDTIRITYEDLCRSPQRVVDSIVAFAKQRQIRVNPRLDLPQEFAASHIEPDTNDETRHLVTALKARVANGHEQNLPEIFLR
ncbi:sulfotransferase [Sulfurimonas diazotrophicus]|uniref:Sulfotransferase n=1 Tax=Sulfurimonas diazotrophicus TaxID=3131939 RepID=A0ABZ3H8W0_9BACT